MQVHRLTYLPWREVELYAVIVYSPPRLYSNFHAYHPEGNNIPQGGFIIHLQFE